MFRIGFIGVVAVIFLGCDDLKEDTGSPLDDLASLYALDPGVAGRNMALDVHIDASGSDFVFGATDIDLGEGIFVESVTVLDGFEAVASIVVDEDALLGFRDVTLFIENQEIEMPGGFEVIDQSFQVEPDNGKIGEMVEVALVGTGTDWESGYTWASFGPGVEVTEFNVMSPTLASAILAVHPDAPPGERDVAIENGPEVVTLTDGFTVDRAGLGATFEPNEAYQGDTVEFTIRGSDTNWNSGTVLTFWDDGGSNADISVMELTVIDNENMYGKIRLSNAAAIGMRDVFIVASEDVLVPDAMNVLDAPPDLSKVAIGLGFNVYREVDNGTGTLLEGVSAYAYFVIPLDPPCGPMPPSGSGPNPYDVNGVFPVPPEADPMDCPEPETVSAGDYVWFECPENIVTMHKDVIQSTGQVIYRGQNLTLDDYRFNQMYDLHTQGDPDGIPEVLLEGVQPTVPADYYLLSPDLWNNYTQSRYEDFNYTWTPAQTYPTAIFFTQINGTLEADGSPGFAASIPWDDGVHGYTPAEMAFLESGSVTFYLVSFVEGPYFGFSFSTIQTNQSDSVLQTAAQVILE